MRRATGDCIARVWQVRFAEEEGDATRQPAAAAEALGRRPKPLTCSGLHPRPLLWEPPSPFSASDGRCSSES